MVGNVWPLATVQTCIIHLIRNTFTLASKKDWCALKRDVKPIYTASSPNAAKAALDELTEKWGKRYGAIIRLWESAWEEFIPFLDYDLEIRSVICSTNAIKSLNARYRRAVQSALKCWGLSRWRLRAEEILSPEASTRPVRDEHDGQYAGSPLRAHSPSPSTTAGRPRKPIK